LIFEKNRVELTKLITGNHNENKDA